MAEAPVKIDTIPAHVVGLNIHHKIAELNDNAEQLEEQAERAVVDSEESLAKAGDLYRVIRSQENEAESTRKSVTAPVRKWVDMVNALFKTSKAKRDNAAKLISKKSNKFQLEREKAARAAAEAARKEAEEQALKAAEAAAQANDDASVEAILEMGSNAAEEIEKTSKPELVRGDYGSTVGTRKTISGEITHVHEFLRAIADEKIPGMTSDDLVAFKKAGLNALARKVEAEGIVIPGFAAVVESTTNFR